MLGSPCSPCCAGGECSPSQVASIVSAVSSGTCVLQWQGVDIEYQEAASEGYRQFSSQDWQVVIHKAQQSPPSTITLALDLSHSVSGEVRFVMSAPDWKAEVLVLVGAVGSTWPGTSCGVRMRGNIYFNGISNYDPTVGYAWRIDKSFSPTLSPTSLGEYFALQQDLSSQAFLASGYATTYPAWPAALDWSSTSCQPITSGLNGWYACYDYGFVAGSSDSPSVSGDSASFTYSPPTGSAKTLNPTRRWRNGVYSAPTMSDFQAYNGRLTSMSVTVSL